MSDAEGMTIAFADSDAVFHAPSNCFVAVDVDVERAVGLFESVIARNAQT